jgi:hypothetical protein
MKIKFIPVFLFLNIFSFSLSLYPKTFLSWNTLAPKTLTKELNLEEFFAQKREAKAREDEEQAKGSLGRQIADLEQKNDQLDKWAGKDGQYTKLLTKLKGLNDKVNTARETIKTNRDRMRTTWLAQGENVPSETGKQEAAFEEFFAALPLTITEKKICIQQEQIIADTTIEIGRVIETMYELFVSFKKLKLEIPEEFERINTSHDFVEMTPDSPHLKLVKVLSEQQRKISDQLIALQIQSEEHRPKAKERIKSQISAFLDEKMPFSIVAYYRDSYYDYTASAINRTPFDSDVEALLEIINKYITYGEPFIIDILQEYFSEKINAFFQGLDLRTFLRRSDTVPEYGEQQYLETTCGPRRGENIKANISAMNDLIAMCLQSVKIGRSESDTEFMKIYKESRRIEEKREALEKVKEEVQTKKPENTKASNGFKYSWSIVLTEKGGNSVPEIKIENPDIGKIKEYYEILKENKRQIDAIDKSITELGTRPTGVLQFGAKAEYDRKKQDFEKQKQQLRTADIIAKEEELLRLSNFHGSSKTEALPAGEDVIKIIDNYLGALNKFLDAEIKIEVPAYDDPLHWIRNVGINIRDVLTCPMADLITEVQKPNMSLADCVLNLRINYSTLVDQHFTVQQKDSFTVYDKLRRERVQKGIYQRFSRTISSFVQASA